MTVRTQVLIIGGGLSGLTAAGLLAQLGLSCIVVERHAGTSIQYKFAGISPRSMEVFRGLGIENEIRSHKTGDQQGGEIARGKNLADPHLQWSGAAWPDASPFSPTQPATCDQHVLEPVLRRRAEMLGADIRFGTELRSFFQDSSGVCATLSRGEDATEVIEADYLVAADGANGTIRDQLGIGRHGPGVLQHWMNLIFETDLQPTLAGRRFTSCFVSEINATFTPRQGGRWLLALQYSPQNGEKPEDFDAGRCRDLVRKGAGRDDVRAELVDARSWNVAASVADSFRSGRCFLIGDAAHLMPPTGAFGGNSGIHDAHNLSWKLAYVLRGWAGESLLDSYDAERRPIIEATLAQSLARLQRWFRDTSGRLPPPVEIVPDYDVVLGQRLGATAFADHQSLSGEAFTRIPHVLIDRSGVTCSTLDLVGQELLLLSASDGWHATAAVLSSQGFPLQSVRLGHDVSSEQNLPRRFGVTPEGALLVRPDGFVAWRATAASADRTLQLGSVVRNICATSV